MKLAASAPVRRLRAAWRRAWTSFILAALLFPRVASAQVVSPASRAADDPAAPPSTPTSTPPPADAPIVVPLDKPHVPAEASVGATATSVQYVLEGIEVRGNTSTRTHVVLRYVPFKVGAMLSADDPELERVRFRLLGTGFFKDVQLSLKRGSSRGQAILVVSVAERNTILVNGLWLGLASDADPSGTARPLTAFAGLDVSEINLAGTGVTVGGAFALAAGQLGLRARFADPEIFHSGWGAYGVLLYNNARDFFGYRDVVVDDPKEPASQDYAVARYKRFGGLVGANHDVGGVSNQIYLQYRLEKIDTDLPISATHLRGNVREPIDFYLERGTSVLSSVQVSLVHDTRDEPVLPTRGVNAFVQGELAISPLGSDYGYGKIVSQGSTWFKLPWGHVLRLEGTAGALFGNAPLFERFFVGDQSDFLPDRVLDLNFNRRPVPNFLGTAINEVRYGKYVARVLAEYRLPIYRGKRTTYGIDLFAQVGAFALADSRDLTNPAPGFTGLAQIPLDLTMNAGLRLDTVAGGITLGLANVLAFVPLRGEAR